MAEIIGGGIDSDKVKVAIRVRPFNRREIELKTKCVVEVKRDQTILHYVHVPPAASSTSSATSITAQTPSDKFNQSFSGGSNSSNKNHHHHHHQHNANTTSTSSNDKNNSQSNSFSNQNGNSSTTSSSSSNTTTTTTTTTASSASYRPPKTFTFDNCFWSFDEADPHYASQEYVFKQLGTAVLDSAFQGYNACIFAYGQTGSGKSYTMMGSPHEKGLIPRLCDEIFERISAQSAQDDSATFKLEVSYMEIYNEKVHDLLDPAGSRQSLKVREHNILGPYVDGLSTLAVSSFAEIDSLMAEGNKSRTVASTNMNSESSRSHAVFTLTLTCSVYDSCADVRGERVSKMSLVDLAGSERAVKTGAVGERLKEGSNINKSLTTLGLVISKLADQASGKSGRREQFVPYRDSVLTWLLKDNLGGNSKTIMISTISPAADSYEETLSTLRYADRAKRIVNHAVINEDPNNRIIRELRTEVEQLREQLMHATVQTELQERLAESEKLIKEMEQTWEEKLRKTEKIHHERQQALEKMGISVQSSGIAVEKDRYYLINLNADPSMNALLVYYLKERTLIGRSDSSGGNSSGSEESDPGIPEQDIQLSGVGIAPEHAIIWIDRNRNEIWMEPINGARTYVNGRSIVDRVMLRNGDRILWGNNHFFSLNCPASTNQTQSQSQQQLMNRSMHENDFTEYADYHFARDEMLSLNNPDMEAAIFALERQFDGGNGNSGELSYRASSGIHPAQHHQQMAPHQHWPMTYRIPGSSPHELSGSVNTLLPSASGKFGGSMMGRFGGSTLNLASPNAMMAMTVMRMEKLAAEREENFRIALSKLREEIATANTLAHEANLISEEMRRGTEFKVTLQIPAANLSPNRLRRGMFVSEPAILVKRKNFPQQVWSKEKFETNLLEMRDLYADWKERQNGRKSLQNQDSFDSQTSTTSAANSDTYNSQSSPLSSPRIEHRNDPFYERQENHSLIGVANIFLEVLMQDVMLDYQVPIISQQGEVSGRLWVEFGRIEGQFGERIADASASDIDSTASDDGTSSSSSSQDDSIGGTVSSSPSGDQPLKPNQVRLHLHIKCARGLPPGLSNFVFCQYSVWGYPDLIAVPATWTEPGSDFMLQNAASAATAGNASTVAKFGATNLSTGHSRLSNDEKIFQFDYQRNFAITLSEEFLEHCTDGALSIEVWGHRVPAALSPAAAALKTDWAVKEEQIKICRSLADRWLELKRKLELWIEIAELNDQGEYAPVEVQSQPDVFTGGVYQLRQGQQRRISVSVLGAARDSGSLPLVCESIHWIAVGCVYARKKPFKSLDSYQEAGLATLDEKWNDILARRQEYLQEQLNELMRKTNKSNEEVDREHRLMNQWMSLVEERNAAKCPAPGSEIPGAPVDDWEPAPGMENHIPVIFLDLNNDDLNISSNIPTASAASAASGAASDIPGADSILPKEHNGSPFFNLPIVACSSDQIGAGSGDATNATVLWDSSIHESGELNRLTGPDERIFLIVKTCVRLSHPAPINVILRKRIAINVYKKQSITKSIFKRISRADIPIFGTGVTYEVVASIPKASEDIEDRESLALLAASAVDLTACDGESYIERYTKSVSAVEEILALDRLRQEVAVREQLTKKIKFPARTNVSQTMSGGVVNGGSSITSSRASLSRTNEALLRKTVSVPNMAQFTVAQRQTNTATPAHPRTAASAANTPTSGALPYRPIGGSGGAASSTMNPDSAYSSYLSNAAASLRQKASSIFGSMTGLNLLATDNSVDGGCAENASSSSTIAAPDSATAAASAGINASRSQSIVTSGVATSSPLSSLMSGNASSTTPSGVTTPTTGATVNRSQLKPMRTVLEEQNSREDDEYEHSSPKSQTTDDDACFIVFRNHNNNSLPPRPKVAKSPVPPRTITPNLSIGSNGSSSLDTNSASDSLMAAAAVEERTFSKNESAPSSSLSIESGADDVDDIDEDVEGEDNNDRNEDYNLNKLPSKTITIINYDEQDQMDSGFDCGKSLVNAGSAGAVQSSANLPQWMVVGESVRISPDSKLGVIGFVGETKFAAGIWVGVVLDSPTGKNDGTVDGVRYFSCKPKFGIFVKPDKLKCDPKGRVLRQTTTAAAAIANKVPINGKVK